MTTPRRFSMRGLVITAPHRPDGAVARRVRRMRARFVFEREMKLRLLSGAILIPLVLLVTALGAVPFGALLTVTATLVLFEWQRMMGLARVAAVFVPGVAALAAAALLALVTSLPIALAALGAGTLAVLVAVRGALWPALGVVYSGIALLALLALRQGADGFGAVIVVFLTAWASDTFAFLVGRKVGGARLWPAVSPSKTWSGAFGGLLAGTLVGGLVAVGFGAPLGGAAFAVAALVSVAAQAGDLLESAIKRRFDVKDAGQLIPGHGGVMDRVDGLVVAGLSAAGLGAAMAAGTPAAGFFSAMGRG